MIGEILDAILKETRALLSDTGATVIFMSDFRATDLTNYKPPLVLIEIPDGVESTQYLGGVTRMDYNINFNAYEFEPDAYVDDSSGYSTGLLNFIDMIRRHFSYGGKGSWITPDMSGLENQFGFRMTFVSVGPPLALDKDGLMKGFKIIFDTISIDENTALVLDSAVPLETVTQEDQNLDTILTVTKKGFNVLSYENITGVLQIAIPANTYVDSVLAQLTSNAPQYQIGTTPGGNDFVPIQTPGAFGKFTVSKLLTVDTILYVTITSGNLNLSLVVGYNIF